MSSVAKAMKDTGVSRAVLRVKLRTVTPKLARAKGESLKSRLSRLRREYWDNQKSSILKKLERTNALCIM